MSVSIRVEDAAKLLGIKPAAVYKAIDHCNIPAEKHLINGKKTEVSIPADMLLLCVLDRQKKPAKALAHLKDAEQRLRRLLNG